MHAPLPDQTTQTPTAALNRPWQVFKRANVQYAIALEDGVELLEHTAVAAIPFPPKGVVGLVNWHGNAIALADIAQLQGAPRRMEAGRALVLGHGEDAVALALDTLPNVVRLAPEHVRGAQEAPAGLRDLLAGILSLPDQSHAFWLNVQRVAHYLTTAPPQEAGGNNDSVKEN